MHENLDFTPKDYKKGKTKFIIVTGSVISGLGKGTFTSALATLFQFYNLKVSMMKFDGYLNVDAGTLNPYRHGEVFVLDDGTETDLDLGSYERTLHRNITKDNSLTSGKLFKIIIDKERKGNYLGRDVQFIPHVTGEIKNFIRNVAMKENSDIFIIEIGGTVGDIENSYFMEAIRELQHNEGKKNVVFVNVTYIIDSLSLGGQKSKAAQLGVTRLMSLGIQPDIIVCRADKKVKDNIKEKISLVSNLPIKNIISLEDFSSIYEVPFYLKKQEVDKIFFDLLNIKPKPKKENYNRWLNFLSNLKNRKDEIIIAITGKYTDLHDSYLSILKALEHVSVLLRQNISIRWIETTNSDNIEERLKGVKGIIVPGGFGSRGIEGKIKVIEYARKNNIPFLGLCLGFQLAVVEYSRNVLNLGSANSTEIEPNNVYPVIDLLPEQKNISKKGATMRLGGHEVSIKTKTLAHKIYKKPSIIERFRHRYEVNPDYIKQLEDAGLMFSGISKENKNIMQILELPENKHKFFFATQFHAEYLSRPLTPSPIFIAFIESCLSKEGKGFIL
ncbi:MAG: CTP synthase [Nanoarchaeota archaeon]